jgi:hypothetical protein
MLLLPQRHRASDIVVVSFVWSKTGDLHDAAVPSALFDAHRLPPSKDTIGSSMNGKDGE